jgi:hypothetical protein
VGPRTCLNGLEKEKSFNLPGSGTPDHPAQFLRKSYNLFLGTVSVVNAVYITFLLLDAFTELQSVTYHHYVCLSVWKSLVVTEWIFMTLIFEYFFKKICLENSGLIKV